MTYIDKYGYSRLSMFNTLVHREVARIKFGRNLRWFEIIHHIDGDKQNNHPDNLFVCSRDFHELIHRHRIKKDKFWRFVYARRKINSIFYRKK